MNDTITEGTIVTGQEAVWEQHMTDKYESKSDWEKRHSPRFPYGNPGPGRVSRVANITKRSRQCTFYWMREKRDYSKTRTNFTCSADELLNLEAYKKGDLKIFFDDPRTRAQYLQWARLLLTAEDYVDGKISVD